MNQLPENNLFLITHIVNPNHFYLCEKLLFDLDLSVAAEKHLLQYMQKLDEKKLHNDCYEPQIDDCVAYYLASKKKYIRCEVVDIKKQYDSAPCFILFAFDYGIPLVLKSKEDLVKIPDHFKSLPSQIIRCGLDILPATTTFCLKKQKQASKYHHEWALEGLQCFWKLITDKTVVEFEHTQKDIKYKNTRFGILKVLSRNGDIVDVNQRLVNAEVALRPKTAEDFWKNFNSTSTPNIEVWNDNFRSGGIMKEAEKHNDILPNFNRLFHDMEQPKTTIRMLSVIEKVTEWQKRNEGVQHEIPDEEFEDKDDSEILFELNNYNNDDDYITNDITNKNENKDDVEEQLSHEQIRSRLEKLATFETESIKIKLRNKANKMELYPCGYQIQLVVQPNYKDNFNEEIIPTHSAPPRDAAFSKMRAVNFDDDEKW